MRLVYGFACDPSHSYDVVRTPTEINLRRSRDQIPSPENSEIVSLPAQAGDGLEDFDLLDEAVRDGAWG